MRSNSCLCSSRRSTSLFSGINFSIWGGAMKMTGHSLATYVAKHCTDINLPYHLQYCNVILNLSFYDVYEMEVIIYVDVIQRCIMSIWNLVYLILLTEKQKMSAHVTLDHTDFWCAGVFLFNKYTLCSMHLEAHLGVQVYCFKPMWFCRRLTCSSMSLGRSSCSSMVKIALFISSLDSFSLDDNHRRCQPQELLTLEPP